MLVPYAAGDERLWRGSAMVRGAAEAGPSEPGRPAGDARSLAAALAPQLIDACGGRLSNITWFRTDWQRGGAATATATLALSSSQNADVVIKLPVVQRELIWTTRLQSDDGDPVVPRLYAFGEELAGYDLAWVVIERLPFGPLGTKWHEGHIPRIAEAAARFCAAASAYPIDREPKSEDWDELLADALEAAKVNKIDQLKRWTAAIKTLRDRLARLVSEWNNRPIRGWVHGDLHVANAMSRVAMDHGPVTLIDLAEVRPGHWVEDAVYLERLLWASPTRLRDHKPVKAIAEARRRLGLPVERDDHRLAMIRRALLAGTAIRFIKSEGSPAYLAACLERLEAANNDLR
jgi:hypothetical protein